MPGYGSDMIFKPQLKKRSVGAGANAHITKVFIFVTAKKPETSSPGSVHWSL
jgi:hypothetical protein